MKTFLILFVLFVSSLVFAEDPKDYNNFLCKYDNYGGSFDTINIFCDYENNFCKSKFIEEYDHESLIWDNTTLFYDDYNSLTFFLTKNPSVGGPRHSLITIYRHLSNGKIVTKGDLMDDPINVLPSVRTVHDKFAPGKLYYDNEHQPLIKTNAHAFLGICVGTNQ